VFVHSLADGVEQRVEFVVQLRSKSFPSLLISRVILIYLGLLIAQVITTIYWRMA
jgi:hypothetical protein